MGVIGGVALVGMTLATGGLALLPAAAMAAVPALGTGVALGAASGAAQADIKYKGIIQTCLAGRGYRVLD
jgi:aspartate oxidase